MQDASTVFLLLFQIIVLELPGNKATNKNSTVCPFKNCIGNNVARFSEIY
jgi:hypothetical protein